MDYKEKATILRVCSSKEGERCSHCPAFGQGNRHCRRNAMRYASVAITELLARAEEAEARAEKAEQERDAAIKELDGVSSAVDDLSEFIDEQIHPLVPYDMYLALRENSDSIAMWDYESEWRGQKEE